MISKGRDNRNSYRELAVTIAGADKAEQKTDRRAARIRANDRTVSPELELVKGSLDQ